MKHFNPFKWALLAMVAVGLGAGCVVPPADTGEFQTGFDQEVEESAPTPTREVADLSAIYFDFDRSRIRDDQKPTLRDNVAVIQEASWKVVVEGHCDERGSDEYNLALGERRANAVRQYLVDSGVARGRIDTVSYGEARPAVQGNGEAVWSYNRRAEFRMVEE